jgi:TolA-binding protein
VVEKYPDDALLSYASYQLGMVLVELGNRDQAIAAFEKVKREDKSIFRAAQAEIGKLLATTDPEAAIENYGEIVAESETQEDSAIAMIGIGDVYVAIKKWEDAAQSFGEVYDFYKGTDTTLLAGALVKWTDALVNSKNFREAIRVSKIMQDRFPDNAFTINTMYYRANAHFSLGEFSRARKVFASIIELNKSEQLTEIAMYQKADCLYFTAVKIKDAEPRDRQYRAAIGEYGEYLKKYPKGKYTPRALYMQGNAYWTLGNTNQAKEAEYFRKAATNFERVMNSYPDFAEICNVKNFLAFSLDKLNQWKRALKLYNSVLRNRGCDKKAITFAKEQSEMVKGRN